MTRMTDAALNRGVVPVSQYSKKDGNVSLYCEPVGKKRKQKRSSATRRERGAIAAPIVLPPVQLPPLQQLPVGPVASPFPQVPGFPPGGQPGGALPQLPPELMALLTAPGSPLSR